MRKAREPQVTTSYRLPREMKERLARLAEHERRSANAMLVLLLDDALEAYGYPRRDTPQDGDK